MADAVGAYRREVATWLDEYPDPDARRFLGELRAHERRIDAVDGDVPTEAFEGLLAAARHLGGYLRSGDADALERAADRLAEIG